MNQYFYIDNEGKQKGTFTPEELRKEQIRKETLVWTQGMSQWKRAIEVIELQYLFAEQAHTSYTPIQKETVDVPPTVDSTVSAASTVAASTATYVNATAPAAQNTTNVSSPYMPKTYLVESILVTFLPLIFCGNLLSLLGIIGIINAAQVESYFHRGSYDEALAASKQAGRWTKITLWIAVIWLILIVAGIILSIIFFGALAGVGSIGNALSV